MIRAFRAWGGRLAAVAVVATAWASAVGDVILPDPNGSPGPGLLFGLTATLETDGEVYHLGESVHATYRVMNETGTPYLLQLNQSPAFNMWVLFDGVRIWSDTWGSLPVQTSLVVAPGESFVNEYTWDLTDNEGNLVPPGEYEVMGVTHGGAPSLGTTVTIVPEPATFAVLALSFWFVPRRRAQSTGNRA